MIEILVINTVYRTGHNMTWLTAAILYTVSKSSNTLYANKALRTAACRIAYGDECRDGVLK